MLRCNPNQNNGTPYFSAIVLLMIGLLPAVSNAAVTLCQLKNTSQQDDLHEDAITLAKSLTKKMTGSGALTYSYNFQGEGTAKTVFPPSSGNALIVPGEKPGQISSAKLVGEKRTENGEAPDSYHVILHDEIVYSINDSKRMVVRAPFYRGGMNIFNSKLLAPIEFFVLVEDILNDDPVKLQTGAGQDINGVPCANINFGTETGVEIRMFVGEKDSVLYRLEATMSQLGGWDAGKLVIELSEFEFGVVAEDEDFLSAIPDEFTLSEYSGNYPAIGQVAPPWSLTTQNGKEIALAELKGQVVVMDFWATWCLPCIKGIPRMQQLHEKFADQPVRILGITYKEEGDPLAMMQRQKADYPILKGDSIAAEYNLASSGLPITYVIGADGKVVDFFMGGDAIERHLEAAIERALQIMPKE